MSDAPSPKGVASMLQPPPAFGAAPLNSESPGKEMGGTGVRQFPFMPSRVRKPPLRFRIGRAAPEGFELLQCHFPHQLAAKDVANLHSLDCSLTLRVFAPDQLLVDRVEFVA